MATEDPKNPTDTPLLEVLERLDAAGWDGQFRALEQAQVQCLTCRTATAASDVQADEVTRLEGVSDPADMVMVVPLTCPSCETRGTLVLHYGPEASLDDAEVAAALDRSPHEPTPGVTAPRAAPG